MSSPNNGAERRTDTVRRNDDAGVTADAHVTASEWYSLPALALETDHLRLITVPVMGGKIVSIFDRDANREWLLPPKDGRLQPADYGASFVDQDMSGWDEMFPTIDACAYPVEGAYAGAHLPDHGEVWPLSWAHNAQTADAIQLSVSGRALPYTLSRTIHATGGRALRLSYEVVNTGDEPLAALWAAHPQFTADEATRIVLPDGVSHIINVHPSDELPITGQICTWPETPTPDARPLPLNRIRPASAHKCRKFYLPPDQPVQWAGLQQGEAGAWLRLSWNPSEIPYLGVWVDEGTYNPLPTAALEPSTGYYDILTLAWQNQRVMTLPPGTPVRWSLDLELGDGRLS